MGLKPSRPPIFPMEARTLCSYCQERHSSHPHAKRAASAADCFICHGLMDHIPRLASEALGKSAGKEWDSFLVQTTFGREVLLREEAVFDEEPLDGAMAIKNQCNRIAIDYLVQASGKPFHPQGDMSFVLDFIHMAGKANPTNLYIFGHYLKKTRTYCQHDWACSACRGRGCRVCNFHKQNYPSIEGALRGVFAPAFGASDAHLHASGREDVDVMHLEGGRPFVLELVHPAKRTADLPALAAQVATLHPLEVLGLKYCSLSWVEMVCNSHFDKHYRAWVVPGPPEPGPVHASAAPLQSGPAQVPAAPKVADAPVRPLPKSRPFSPDDLNKLLARTPVFINQQTPVRVMGRRSDLVRARRVYEIKPVSISKDEWVLDIFAEAGTYIKEFVHSDQGRTVPSVSGILGFPCRCKQLDVMGVEDLYLRTLKAKNE